MTAPDALSPDALSLDALSPDVGPADLACSADAADAGELLPGTAPTARAWIVLEQPGPWGRDAVHDSRLPASLAEHLAGAKALGITVLLARHPDRPERAAHGERHAWVARTVPGGHLLRHAVLDSLDAVADWDLAAIAAGHLPPVGAVDRAGVTLVCTNAQRDQCCAVLGRPLLTDAIGRAADRLQVWECSHVGGHRFAPVVLSLPSGAVYGRVRPAHLDAILSGTGPVDCLRGLSGLPAAGQAASIAVAAAEPTVDAAALDVLAVVGDRAVPLTPTLVIDLAATTLEVRSPEGRAWRVRVDQVPLRRARRESCGKEPLPGVRWVAADLVRADRWT